MKKLNFLSLTLIISLIISSCGNNSLDYDSPEQVKEYLVHRAYKANESSIEVNMHFFKNGEGTLSAYNNGSPVGNDQTFTFTVGEATDAGDVKIETSIGQMQLEEDGKISYLNKGDWFFFTEWTN